MRNLIHKVRRGGARSAICITAAMLAFSCAAHAGSFSAVDDFSIAANPNGAWLYDYTGALLSTAVTGTGALTGFNYWWNSLGEPNSALVGQNSTGSPITIAGVFGSGPAVELPSGYLSLDPEGNSYVEARFTAPASGSYSIAGNFLGIDTSEISHPVAILDNGTPILSNTISSYSQSDPFSLNETLNAGDTIQFVVYTGSSFTNLSTGLAATISSDTPEPATLWIAGLGLAGLLLGRRAARGDGTGGPASENTPTN